MEKIFILAGAGFSYSLSSSEGRQVLTAEFSNNIKEDILALTKSFTKEIESRSLDWFIKDIENNNFHFEHFCEKIWFLGELNHHHYPLGVTNEFLGQLYEFIHTQLFISYSRPQCDKSRRIDFIKMIQYLLSKDYEVHIFDLNFDSVLEDCLKAGEIIFEDFFEREVSFHATKYMNKTIVSREHSGRKENDKQVFIYKLHGAFNIVSISDELKYKNTGYNPIPKSNKSYSGIPFGFYKIKIEDYMLDDLEKNFIQGISNLSFIDGFNVQTSLWTSNYMKLKFKSLDQTYPSFCYDSYKKVLKDSKARFIVGYGSMDTDINRALLDRCRNEALIGIKPCKTYVEIDEDSRLCNSLINQGHDTKFEDYLKKFEGLE